MKALRLEFKGGNPFKPEPAVNDLLYFQRNDTEGGSGTKVSRDPYVSAAFYGEDPRPDIKYSTDNGQTFKNWESAYDEEEQAYVYDTIILGNNGDKVLFKGVNERFSTAESGFNFITQGTGIEAGGSVTSLLDGDGVTLQSIPDYAFKSLFSYTNITKAPSLGNVTSIGKSGCLGMFSYCKNIHEAANMDNVQTIGTKGCEKMYRNSNVRSAADMKSLTNVMEQGLVDMYNGCRELTSAADMGGVEVFGQSAFLGMYGETQKLVLLEGESLTFEFPNLPVDAGSNTFTTNEQVVEEMKYSK